MLISLGHTKATREEMLIATAAGATSVCHLFNTFERTGEIEPGVWKPGLVEFILDNKKLSCELICDMQHVLPEYVRMAEASLRPHRFIAITDSMTGAGLPPGDYQMVDGRWYSTNAARLLGLERDMGAIEPGRKANLAVLNESYDCVATFIEREKLYGT